MEIAFWFIASLIFYGYFGYVVFMAIVSRFVNNPVNKGAIEPRLTLLIAAYNEEKDIAAKLDNALALDYPPDKLEIMVVSDGSTDGTDEIVRSFHNRGVRLVRVEGRKGKTVSQNEAVRHASGEIIVFSDATTVYDPLALRMIVRNFNDPSVGCVTGRLRYVSGKNSSVSAGEKSYWEYEVMVKKFQSEVWTLTGATGCIYAVRKTLYTPLPADIISDLVEPLAILQKGFRVVFEPEAIACEAACEGKSDEMKMRRRVVARGIRGFIYMRALFNPLKNPWLFFQLVSHKLIRWLFFELAFIMLLINLFLLPRSLYVLTISMQALFYLSALAGYFLQRLRWFKAGALGYPLYFVLIHAASLFGAWEVLGGRKNVTWETNR